MNKNFSINECSDNIYIGVYDRRNSMRNSYKYNKICYIGKPSNFVRSIDDRIEDLFSIGTMEGYILILGICPMNKSNFLVELFLLHGHKFRITDLLYYELNCCFISASSDGEICFWSLTDFSCIYSFSINDCGTSYHLSLNPTNNNEILVWGYSGYMYIFKNDSRLLNGPIMIFNFVMSATYTFDGDILCAVTDFLIVLDGEKYSVKKRIFVDLPSKDVFYTSHEYIILSDPDLFSLIRCDSSEEGKVFHIDNKYIKEFKIYNSEIYVITYDNKLYIVDFDHNIRYPSFLKKNDILNDVLVYDKYTFVVTSSITVFFDDLTFCIDNNCLDNTFNVYSDDLNIYYQISNKNINIYKDNAITDVISFQNTSSLLALSDETVIGNSNGDLCIFKDGISRIFKCFTSEIVGIARIVDTNGFIIIGKYGELGYMEKNNLIIYNTPKDYIKCIYHSKYLSLLAIKYDHNDQILIDLSSRDPVSLNFRSQIPMHLVWDRTEHINMRNETTYKIIEPAVKIDIDETRLDDYNFLIIGFNKKITYPYYNFLNEKTIANATTNTIIHYYIMTTIFKKSMIHENLSLTFVYVLFMLVSTTSKHISELVLSHLKLMHKMIDGEKAKELCSELHGISFTSLEKRHRLMILFLYAVDIGVLSQVDPNTFFKYVTVECYKNQGLESYSMLLIIRGFYKLIAHVDKKEIFSFLISASFLKNRYELLEEIKTLAKDNYTDFLETLPLVISKADMNTILETNLFRVTALMSSSEEDLYKCIDVYIRLISNFPLLNEILFNEIRKVAESVQTIAIFQNIVALGTSSGNVIVYENNKQLFDSNVCQGPIEKVNVKSAEEIIVTSGKNIITVSVKVISRTSGRILKIEEEDVVEDE